MSPAEEEDWGFTAQQAVEKMLKAWIVLADQQPPRRHDLAELAKLACLDLDPALRELQTYAVEAVKRGVREEGVGATRANTNTRVVPLPWAAGSSSPGANTTCCCSCCTRRGIPAQSRKRRWPLTRRA